ncbi:UNVERIFIED_CONTAM: hypothetical protein FKN15_016919 [Acipenser sinensis]
MHCIYLFVQLYNAQLFRSPPWLQFHSGPLGCGRRSLSVLLIGEQRGKDGPALPHRLHLPLRECGGASGVPAQAPAPARGQPLRSQPADCGPLPDRPGDALCDRRHRARRVAPGPPAVPGPGGPYALVRLRRGQHHHRGVCRQVPGHHPPALLPSQDDPSPGDQPDRLHLGSERPAEHPAALRLGGHRLRQAPPLLHAHLVLQLLLLRPGGRVLLLGARLHHAGLLLDGVQGCQEAEQPSSPGASCQSQPQRCREPPGAAAAAAAPGGLRLPHQGAPQTLPLPLQSGQSGLCHHVFLHLQHGPLQCPRHALHQLQRPRPALDRLHGPRLVLFPVLHPPLHLRLHAPQCPQGVPGPALRLLLQAGATAARLRSGQLLHGDGRSADERPLPRRGCQDLPPEDLGGRHHIVLPHRGHVQGQQEGHDLDQLQLGKRTERPAEVIRTAYDVTGCIITCTLLQASCSYNILHMAGHRVYKMLGGTLSNLTQSQREQCVRCAVL